MIDDDGENGADVESEVNDEDVEEIEVNEDAETQDEGSINDSVE